MKQIIKQVNGWMKMDKVHWNNIKSGIKTHEGRKIGKGYVSGWKVVTSPKPVNDLMNTYIRHNGENSFIITKEWRFIKSDDEYYVFYCNDFYKVLGFINIQNPYANPYISNTHIFGMTVYLPYKNKYDKVAETFEYVEIDKQSYDFWKENYDGKHDWNVWDITEWKEVE